MLINQTTTDISSPDYVWNGQLILANIGRLGITARVHLISPEASTTGNPIRYELTAGKIIECHRDGIEIFGVDSFMHPTEPSDPEIVMCAMIISPWNNFDTFIVRLCAGLAKLFKSCAPEAEVIHWINRKLGVEEKKE